MDLSINDLLLRLTLFDSLLQFGIILFFILADLLSLNLHNLLLFDNHGFLYLFECGFATMDCLAILLSKDVFALNEFTLARLFRGWHHPLFLSDVYLIVVFSLFIE